MIFNQKINRLMEVDIVQAFMHRHDMQGNLCIKGDNFSFILYRLPYVVEFHDALIENYLEISLSDLSTELLIGGSSAVGCSLKMGLQNLVTLREKNFDTHPQLELFLSEKVFKMDNLYTCLEAIDKLLPLIEAKGGLSSMCDGTFDSRFDFKDHLKPMYFGLKEKYLKCIG
jgi:hypothetical protein